MKPISPRNRPVSVIVSCRSKLLTRRSERIGLRILGLTMERPLIVIVGVFFFVSFNDRTYDHLKERARSCSSETAPSPTGEPSTRLSLIPRRSCRISLSSGEPRELPKVAHQLVTRARQVWNNTRQDRCGPFDQVLIDLKSPACGATPLELDISRSGQCQCKESRGRVRRIAYFGPHRELDFLEVLHVDSCVTGNVIEHVKKPLQVKQPRRQFLDEVVLLPSGSPPAVNLSGSRVRDGLSAPSPPSFDVPRINHIGYVLVIDVLQYDGGRSEWRNQSLEGFEFMFLFCPERNDDFDVCDIYESGESSEELFCEAGRVTNKLLELVENQNSVAAISRQFLKPEGPAPVI